MSEVIGDVLEVPLFTTGQTRNPVTEGQNAECAEMDLVPIGSARKPYRTILEETSHRFVERLTEHHSIDDVRAATVIETKTEARARIELPRPPKPKLAPSPPAVQPAIVLPRAELAADGPRLWKNALVVGRLQRARWIVDLVCAEFGIAAEDVYSQKKTRVITVARGAAMYLICFHTTWSYSAVGRFFQRDHSTVLFADRKAKTRIAESGDFAKKVAKLNDIITSGSPGRQPREDYWSG